jgi:hypothetical protein
VGAMTPLAVTPLTLTFQLHQDASTKVSQ